MRLNWHRPRGHPMPFRQRFARPQRLRHRVLPRPSVPPTCARSAEALACVRRAQIEIAIQQFEQMAERIQIPDCYANTTAMNIRIDRGLLTVRVFVNGELREIIDLPRREEYFASPYGNR